jgi:hypothetical protein
MSDKGTNRQRLLGVVIICGWIAAAGIDVLLAVWTFNHFSTSQIVASVIFIPIWQVAIPGIAAFHGELWALSWYVMVGVMLVFVRTAKE